MLLSFRTKRGALQMIETCIVLDGILLDSVHSAFALELQLL